MLRLARSLPSLAAVALVIGASACATTTRITTEQPGATVTREKDNQVVGQTPVAYESKMWIWESEKVKVEAPGKQPKTVELKRSEPDILPLVGGGLLVVSTCGIPVGLPILLAGGLKLPEETKVKLEDAGPVPNAAAELPAGERVSLRH